MVETTVTTPLEQAINGVEGMAYMTSTSGNDGSASITVTFDVTRDPDLAAIDVQNRVTQARGAPAERGEAGRRHRCRRAPSGFVLRRRRLRRGRRYDPLFLSNYLDVYVRDAIKRVPGVADVIIFGERKYSMRLWLDPTGWRRAGSPPATWSTRCATRTCRWRPARWASRRRARARRYQISVRAVGRLTSADQFENIILKTGDRRLAGAREGRRPRRARRRDLRPDLRFQRLRGRRASACSQLPSANALDVYSGVIAELDRLAARASRRA